MGLFEFTDKVFDFVKDAAGKINQAGQVIETIAIRAGLEKLVDFGKALKRYAGPLAIAPTPILQGGQRAIEAMRWATGDDAEGTESGEAFATGAGDFRDQLELQQKLHPDSNWEGGSASAAYERRVKDQEDRLSVLSGADSDVALVISREVDQLNETRRILDNLHNWLAEYGTYTQTLGVIPVVGKGIQMEAELLAVGMALKEAGSQMLDMQDDANTNAADVRDADGRYQSVADGAVQQDSTGDFNAPASAGEDLKISGPTISALATGQENAATGITDATLVVQGVGANVARTDGFICAVTSEAVTGAEGARNSAGTKTAGISTELAGKLRTAAQTYAATDAAEKAKLDQQMPPG
ncbi:type VII secretion target [Mycobacterium sp. B14F4]|uniref:type VII secretion target n=1 Tax=Mycobacterium sp. B14F4 TaxID=3153565 RepID=UPI00325D5514